jgi:hypothetical protein
VSPDKRQHRGAHPGDKLLFDASQLPALRTSVSELSWLLSRGYPLKASLKIVGDQHRLNERQRLAVSRAACADESLKQRDSHQLAVGEIKNEPLIIDGFNLIITLEAALGGGLLLLSRDRLVRDLSSVHGSYRSVQETEAALHLVGEALEMLGPKSVRWLLDRPISNSGRLAQRINRIASKRDWPWSVEVVFNPDREILSSDEIAVTSDSSILDRVKRWVNFNDYLIKRYLPESWMIDLRV